MTLCECGCGRETTIYHGKHRRFINGHNRRGRKLSGNVKRKMSEANLGNQYWLGYKHSDETKRKISEAQSGEKHPNWKGGLSFEPYCSKFNNSFKESVRNKFDRVCFICGTPENGRKLDVHHVNYDKSCLCSEVKCEFVPLCRSCHMKTNNNREYYENLILEKLSKGLSVGVLHLRVVYV